MFVKVFGKIPTTMTTPAARDAAFGNTMFCLALEYLDRTIQWLVVTILAEWIVFLMGFWIAISIQLAMHALTQGLGNMFM